MLRFSITRFGKTVLNSSCHPTQSSKYKNCKCIYKVLSTESASKVEIEQRIVAEKDRNINTFRKAANKIGLNSSDLTDNTKINVILSSISGDKILKNATTLLDFGFDSKTVTNFIIEYPTLFSVNNVELNRLLNLWQQLDIRGTLLVELLSKHPQLIEIMGPTVLERFGYLLPYFQKDRVVATLLINTPGVVYENWTTLKAKLDFLHSHNIPMVKVASCNALELSLLDIKARFTFLERAGVYKKQIDLDKKDISLKNPTVRNILCSSDQLFAVTIAKLTLVEFEAFTELYRLEQEFLNEEDCDVDSE